MTRNLSTDMMDSGIARIGGAGSGLARALYLALGVLAGFFGFLVLAILALAVVLNIPGEMRANFVMDYVAQDGAGFESYGTLTATFLSTGVICAAYLVVVLILRKVTKTLLAGDPFVPENISRLRQVWLIIAVAELFRMGTGFALGELDIRLGTWFLVFVIAALSEVFRHGAELRRDAELTV